MNVLVAMSGGVDSSVAAALLMQAGHEVIGVTLQLLPCDQAGRVRSCCGYESAPRAREVACQLGIPHYVLDCQAEFDETVLRPSWEEYSWGCTPNPCVWCNQRIKFGRLLDFASDLGADRVATGHHARIVRDRSQGPPVLMRGRDPNKDQSYFLHSLDERQLDRAQLPVGELTKDRVRRIATELGLGCASSPESQDACFVSDGSSFAESLRLRFGRPARRGTIVDDRDRRVGEHPGIHHFTIGQRKGLGVALGSPAWVRSIDPKTAVVRLTTDPAALLSGSLVASDVRFGPCFAEFDSGRCQVQIRYRHPPADASVTRLSEGRALVEFDTPQRAVTPGQAAVLYQGERVIGGGRIDA